MEVHNQLDKMIGDLVMQVIKESGQALLQVKELSFNTICKTGLAEGTCAHGMLDISKLKRGAGKQVLSYFFLHCEQSDVACL